MCSTTLNVAGPDGLLWPLAPMRSWMCWWTESCAGAERLCVDGDLLIDAAWRVGSLAIDGNVTLAPGASLTIAPAPARELDSWALGYIIIAAALVLATLLLVHRRT